MDQLRQVTKQQLLALIPSPLELLAQLLWVPSVMVAITQTILVLSGITKRPRLTLTVMVIGWIVFTVAFVVWLWLFRRRRTAWKTRHEIGVDHA